MSAKVPLEELRQSMSVFLHFLETERQIREEAKTHVGKIAMARAANGQRTQVELLENYLDAGRDTLLRLRVLLGLCGGSRERLQRIYEFAFPNKSLGKIKTDASVRRDIAEFLLAPKSLNIPDFITESFRLPNNWAELLRNTNYLRTLIYRHVMKSKYSVQVGFALENAIKNLLRKNGIPFAKGHVEMVDKKEVDCAIPNILAPKILIMCSYNLTTASNQSARANEQARMRDDLAQYNRRQDAAVRFINVIDGGGWLQRKKDLAKIWRYSDYCFSYNTLPQLVPLVQSLLKP